MKNVKKITRSAVKIENYRQAGIVAIIPLIIIVALVFIGVFVLFRGQAEQKYEGPVEKVRLGLAKKPTTALFFIAEDQGYFRDVGLEVEVKDYPSGKRALVDGLFAGEVDVINTAGVPVVFNSSKRDDFSIFATTVVTDSWQRIIARKDRGIVNPRDIKGKKVATQKASAVHFFLHLFLINNGLSESDIELSFKKAEKLPEALASGEIDAFSMREPFIGQAKKLLGDNAVIFSEKGIFLSTDNAVAFNGFIEKNPGIIKKILRALIKAEEFVKKNNEQAKKIVTERIKADPIEMEEIWVVMVFDVSLRQSLILTLEDQARWAIENNLTDATEVPNYLDYIYTDALEAVKPDAMTIIK